MLHALRYAPEIAERALSVQLLPSLATFLHTSSTSHQVVTQHTHNPTTPAQPTSQHTRTHHQLPNLYQHQQRAQLFSIPGFTDAPAAKLYTEQKLFGHSPDQVFNVVASVEHYHKFVPWCQGSRILLQKEDRYLEAELEVGFQVFTERYLSKVHLDPPTAVRSQVDDSSLFSHLKNQWKFQPGPQPNTTLVDFEVDFAFKSALYNQVAASFFEEVVQRMVGAFEDRCRQLYGPSSLNRRASLSSGSTSDGVKSSSGSSSAPATEHT